VTPHHDAPRPTGREQVEKTDCHPIDDCQRGAYSADFVGVLHATVACHFCGVLCAEATLTVTAFVRNLLRKSRKVL
jgi:hypothetical protein